MQVKINKKIYRCIGKPYFSGDVRLPIDGEIDVSAIRGNIELQANDGVMMRVIDSSKYARWYMAGKTLIGTNAPEPEPVEPSAPVEPEPTEMEKMRADIDYIAAMTGVELA